MTSCVGLVFDGVGPTSGGSSPDGSPAASSAPAPITHSSFCSLVPRMGDAVASVLINSAMDQSQLGLEQAGVTRPGHVADLEERLYVAGKIERPGHWESEQQDAGNSSSAASEGTGGDRKAAGADGGADGLNVSELARRAFEKQARRREVEARLRKRFGRDAVSCGWTHMAPSAHDIRHYDEFLARRRELAEAEPDSAVARAETAAQPAWNGLPLVHSMLFMLESAPRVGEVQSYRLFEPRYRMMLARHFREGALISIAPIPYISSSVNSGILTAQRALVQGTDLPQEARDALLSSDPPLEEVERAVQEDGAAEYLSRMPAGELDEWAEMGQGWRRMVDQGREPPTEAMCVAVRSVLGHEVVAGNRFVSVELEGVRPLSLLDGRAAGGCYGMIEVLGTWAEDDRGSKGAQNLAIGEEEQGVAGSSSDAEQDTTDEEDVDEEGSEDEQRR